MSRKIVLAAATAALLSAVALPALAGTETISKGSWYTAQFGSVVGSFAFGGSQPIGSVGTNPSAILTTASSTSWSVTLTSPQSLTVLDMEESGDQFEVFDNGLSLGDTSTPVGGDGSCGENITCALGDTDYSRGVFFLGDGVNDITIKYLGDVGNGNLNFFVGAPDGGIGRTPEPATWALMFVGLAGLGAMLRGRRRALASAA